MCINIVAYLDCGIMNLQDNKAGVQNGYEVAPHMPNRLGRLIGALFYYRCNFRRFGTDML